MQQTQKKILFIFVPLAAILGIFIFIIFSFYQGISVPTTLMKTKLMNKPIPSVQLANLYQWTDMVDISKLPTKDSPIGHWYLINLWASWCELCREENPFLMDLARQGIVIYGFDYQDDLNAAKKMLSEQGNPYTKVFWDARGIGGSALGVYTVPETYLIDPNGIIRYSLVDKLTKEQWEKVFLPIIFGKNESSEN